MSATGFGPGESWAALAAVGLPLCVYLLIVAWGYDGESQIRGDGGYYLAVAESVWTDHDLDLSNQLSPPLVNYSNHVSLDIHGRLVPKHSILMPLISMPLVVVLGARGALAFNLIALTILLALVFVLARRWVEPWPAMLATSLTGMFSFLPHYAYNYSPDVFLTVLLVAVLVLLPKDREQAVWRHFVAGVVAGAIVAVRPAYVVVLPALPLLMGQPLYRSSAWLVLGLAGSTLIWMAFNIHLFGGPLVTGYDRIAVATHTGFSLHSHRADFTLPLLEGLKGQLLHPTKGLLSTSVISLGSMLGLPVLLQRSWRMGLYVLVTSTALLLLFSKYQYWSESHYGNRFLTPLVVLAALPLGCLIDWILLSIQRPDRNCGARDSSASPDSSTVSAT